jgi:hypothetical protein
MTQTINREKEKSGEMIMSLKVPLKNIWKILPLFLLFAGCASRPFPSSVVSPDQSVTPVPVVSTNGPFTLTIFSPQDKATVSTQSMDLKGEVSSDAVLTINNETYVLNPGAFTQPVSLEEGLNAIQIVASDMNGNEVDLILTITYQP